MMLNILLPFVGIAVIIHFKGLIKIDQKKDSIYPSVYAVFILPLSGLGLRVILDHSFIDPLKIWMYSIPITALIISPILFKTAEFGYKKTSQTISTIIFTLMLFAFSASAISISNIIFDRSEKNIYYAHVSEKYKSGEYDNRLNIKLTAGWHPKVLKESNSIVSKELYNSIQTGDSVLVYVYDGALGFKWYQLSKYKLSTPSTDTLFRYKW